jgi:hypothetical protein
MEMFMVVAAIRYFFACLLLIFIRSVMLAIWAMFLPILMVLPRESFLTKESNCILFHIVANCLTDFIDLGSSLLWGDQSWFMLMKMIAGKEVIVYPQPLEMRVLGSHVEKFALFLKLMTALPPVEIRIYESIKMEFTLLIFSMNSIHSCDVSRDSSARYGAS